MKKCKYEYRLREKEKFLLRQITEKRWRSRDPVVGLCQYMYTLDRAIVSAPASCFVAQLCAVLVKKCRWHDDDKDDDDTDHDDGDDDDDDYDDDDNDDDEEEEEEKRGGGGGIGGGLWWW